MRHIKAGQARMRHIKAGLARMRHIKVGLDRMSHITSTRGAEASKQMQLLLKGRDSVGTQQAASRED